MSDITTLSQSTMQAGIKVGSAGAMNTMFTGNMGFMTLLFGQIQNSELQNSEQGLKLKDQSAEMHQGLANALPSLTTVELKKNNDDVVANILAAHILGEDINPLGMDVDGSVEADVNTKNLANIFGFRSENGELDSNAHSHILQKLNTVLKAEGNNIPLAQVVHQLSKGMGSDQSTEDIFIDFDIEALTLVKKPDNTAQADILPDGVETQKPDNNIGYGELVILLNRMHTNMLDGMNLPAQGSGSTNPPPQNISVIIENTMTQISTKAAVQTPVMPIDGTAPTAAQVAAVTLSMPVTRGNTTYTDGITLEGAHIDEPRLAINTTNQSSNNAQNTTTLKNPAFMPVPQTPAANLAPSLVAQGDMTLYEGSGFSFDFDQFLGFGDDRLDSVLHGIKPAADLTSVQHNMNGLLTQARSGMAPHPATEMVSIHMQRMAGSKSGSEVTIHLDPPDLGKLQIKMAFGQDNDVRAHLLIEKPETLQLLQRDASTLDRMLQNAGLETHSDSLSFELASQDAWDHQNNNSEHSSSKQNGSGESGAEGGDGDIIESEMTIFVDPITGQERINMLV